MSAANESAAVLPNPDGITRSQGLVATLIYWGIHAACVLVFVVGVSTGDLVLLAQRAREGSAAEAQLLREVGRDLGHLLAGVISLLDLRCFLFGGGFSAALDTLEEGLRAGIDERCFGGRSGSIRLLRASLGPSAGWIGAARPLAAR